MNIIIRPWRNEDVDSLVKYANNFKIARNLTNRYPYPYTREDGIQFIQAAQKEHPYNIFAIVVDEEAVGSIGIHIQDDIYCRNAELGYWLGEPLWGRGIVSDVVPEMVKYGFRTWNITRIFARIIAENDASRRVLEKSGFLKEAEFKKTIFKNGRFHDEIVYAIRRKEER